mgnify:CR=1 FL=1
MTAASWASALGLDEPQLAHLGKLAQADAKRGATEDAETQLDLLLMLDPSRRETWTQYLEFHRRQGDTDAVEAMEEVMSWFA